MTSLILSVWRNTAAISSVVGPAFANSDKKGDGILPASRMREMPRRGKESLGEGTYHFTPDKTRMTVDGDDEQESRSESR
jgi:hypothetical protein